MATVTATPCRRTRCSQPENSPAATIPIGIAANSRPSAIPPPTGSPKTVCEISGNTTRGIPKPIATTSMRNDTSSTLCMAA